MPGDGVERTDTTVQKTSFRLGASAFVARDDWLTAPGRALTFEARLLGAHDWKAADDSVQWCRPEGTVPEAPGVGYASDYKGILRVTPRMQWPKDKDGNRAVEVLVIFDVLAQHSILPEVLDYGAALKQVVSLR